LHKITALFGTFNQKCLFGMFQPNFCCVVKFWLTEQNILPSVYIFSQFSKKKNLFVIFFYFLNVLLNLVIFASKSIGNSRLFSRAIKVLKLLFQLIKNSLL